MKFIKCLSAVAGLLAVLISANVQAYIGLCCGKCGGNMPMNIPGGGIPETYEYRVKISPMLMHMEGFQNGMDSINPDGLPGMPTMMRKLAGKFMVVPTQMDMNILNISTGYSFSEKLFSDDSLIPECQSLLLFGVNVSTDSIDERGVLYV